MAEFQELIKQFNRMCWHYHQKCECPMACPMDGVNISQCRKIAFEKPKATEQTVMGWAKSHKEPVYPTWREWLLSVGVISPGVAKDMWFDYNGRFNAPIPADIAQKLGLQPKEG